MSDQLGQKRARDDLADLLGPSATSGVTLQAQRAPVSSNINRRLNRGLLFAGTTSAAAAPPPKPATDLLSQLGMGTSFIQEEADHGHLERLQSSLFLEFHRSSLITSLFSSGAPQFDPLNEPFLAVKSADRPLLIDEKALLEKLGRLHHPVTTLEGSLLANEAPPPPIKLHKTLDELKKERQARVAAKREAHQNKIKDGKEVEEEKLRLRNLNDTLKERYDKDAIGTEAMVRHQMQERLIDHQKANFERHMAALPTQILKREEKLLAKAESDVILNIYRVFPIREQASLGMFVEFANDKRLRGFIAWIDQRDALVVLAGGPAPMRHLDNWLLGRMQWRASADTVCRRIFSTRVHKLDRFSFHEKSKEEASKGADKEQSAAPEEHVEQEPVYMKEFKTIATAKDYFFDVMPIAGPWPSLAFLWRAAMLSEPKATN